MSKAAPFPVPIASICGEDASSSNWIYYRGRLTDDGVVVTHTGDMNFLYRMGFFGKGDLSRGQPEWDNHWRMITLPRTPGSKVRQNSVHAKVTSRRRYLTHLQWRFMATGDMNTLETLKEDQEVVHEETNFTCTDHQGQRTSPSSSTSLASSNLDNIKKLAALAETSNIAKRSEDLTEPEQSMEYEEDESAECRDGVSKQDKITDWGEEEGDSDFWRTEEKCVGATTSTSAGLFREHSAGPDTVIKETSASPWSWEGPETGDAEFWATDSHKDSLSCQPADSSCLALDRSGVNIISSGANAECSIVRSGDRTRLDNAVSDSTRPDDDKTTVKRASLKDVPKHPIGQDCAHVSTLRNNFDNIGRDFQQQTSNSNIETVDIKLTDKSSTIIKAQSITAADSNIEH